MTTAHMDRGDARDIPLDDQTAALVVTSPPYNVGIDYADVDDRLDPIDYADLAYEAAREMDRILRPGGRAFVNVAIAGDTDEHGERFNLPDLWHAALRRAGLKYRETIIWNKGAGNDSTAWGSYLSPNAPNFRGRYEPVLVYFKDRWQRALPSDTDIVGGPGLDITAEDWPHLTTNVWTIPPARSKQHPAVMPIALAKRIIRISTWRHELVVDPFAGSGTTLRAAVELHREAYGVEASPTYVAQWHEAGAQQALAI